MPDLFHISEQVRPKGLPTNKGPRLVADMSDKGRGTMKNIGDKYVKRMTLRMSDRQLSHCVERANHLDISPSDYIRSLINKDIANYYYREARQNENVKRDWNDFLQH